MNHEQEIVKTSFTENEVLEQLDLAFNGQISEYYPKGEKKDIKYNFFLDLEHGYCATAGSRIHLYADLSRWAIVFEKNGYFNRGFYIGVELDYIGNCISYDIEKSTDKTYNYISNSKYIEYISQDELFRIGIKDEKDELLDGLVDPSINEIKIKDKYIKFDNNYKAFEKVGVEVSDYENPDNLVDFDSIARYLHETNPKSISATEEEIKEQIPVDIPKIMTIDEFCFNSTYDDNLPSTQETYQLIAKVLVTKDKTKWNPSKKPNNSWKNWESGHL